MRGNRMSDDEVAYLSQGRVSSTTKRPEENIEDCNCTCHLPRVTKTLRQLRLTAARAIGLGLSFKEFADLQQSEHAANLTYARRLQFEGLSKERAEEAAGLNDQAEQPSSLNGYW